MRAWFGDGVNDHNHGESDGAGGKVDNVVADGDDDDDEDALLIQGTESEARLSQRQMMMIANSRYSGSISTIVVINMFHIISIKNMICHDVLELTLLCIKALQRLNHDISQYPDISSK